MTKIFQNSDQFLSKSWEEWVSQFPPTIEPKYVVFINFYFVWNCYKETKKKQAHYAFVNKAKGMPSTHFVVHLPSNLKKNIIWKKAFKFNSKILINLSEKRIDNFTLNIKIFNMTLDHFSIYSVRRKFLWIIGNYCKWKRYALYVRKVKKLLFKCFSFVSRLHQTSQIDIRLVEIAFSLLMHQMESK